MNKKIEEIRNETDANIYIDRAIAMLKEKCEGEYLVAGYNGIVSLLQYAKESHQFQQEQKQELLEQNRCTCYYFNKFERKANSTCPVHNAKHQQAEQTNPVSDVKELPEVAQLDQVINTYVHAHGSEAYKHIQERFWIAIAAINKAALQTSAAGWSDEDMSNCWTAAGKKIYPANIAPSEENKKYMLPEWSFTNWLKQYKQLQNKS